MRCANPFKRSPESIRNCPPQVARPTSRFIALYGTHVVEFGPINTTIHKSNEQIPIADIDKMRNVYRLILEKMLL